MPARGVPCSPGHRAAVSRAKRAEGRDRLPRKEVVLDTGETLLYSSIHAYIRNHYSAAFCFACGKGRDAAPYIDWHHDPEYPWSRDISRGWRPVCRSCHQAINRRGDRGVQSALGHRP